MGEGVCFTGHRDIPAQELPELKRLLTWVIEQSEELRLFNFYCGGARGFDLLAGSTVIELKQNHPHLKLIMVQPCPDQDAKWNDSDRAQYQSLLQAADQTICLSESYTTGCMFARNQYLVDHSIVCVSYLKRKRTGTAQTVRMARERGLVVLNLAGITPPTA